MSTHTPAISAAIAALTFRGTAILLIVTHSSLSPLLITMPHPLLPLSLKLPFQKPRIAFHIVESPRLSMTIPLHPWAPILAQWSASSKRPVVTTFHGLGDSICPMNLSFLEAPRNNVDFLHGQLFDHLAHDHVFGPVDLIFISLGLFPAAPGPL